MTEYEQDALADVREAMKDHTVSLHIVRPSPTDAPCR